MDLVFGKEGSANEGSLQPLQPARYTVFSNAGLRCRYQVSFGFLKKVMVLLAVLIGFFRGFRLKLLFGKTMIIIL
jgi:hypothetical protein